MSSLFRLTDNFLDQYKHRKVRWGFGALGEVTFYRTYARPIGNRLERWWEVCRRVTEGVYNMQKAHIDMYGLGWNAAQAQRSAQEFYDRMFNMKFLPPGRGLWAMGSEIITERKLYAALFNCSFVSTEDIKNDFARPFCFLMDMSMLGVGVGFDTRGSGLVVLKAPTSPHKTFQIEDSRNGWVQALRLLLESYCYGSAKIEFDYSLIRPAGKPIKGFGGTASGPGPLREGLECIRRCCDGYVGKEIDSRFIVDVMNLIGRIVVSGNVRRSAEIALGEMYDVNFLDLKNYKINKHRESYGWASNNSVISYNSTTDYSVLGSRICDNGEPGIFWIDNARAYGRMGELRPDSLVAGCNPCQSASAPVLTPLGIRTFGDIKVGDVIWSKTGWTTVRAKWSTGVKKVFKFDTGAGYFLGTEKHRVVENGFKVEVRQASSIDVLVGPYHTNHKLNLQDIVDGLVIGDGTWHKANKNKILLIIGEKDKDYFTSEISPFIGSQYDGTSYRVKTTITREELNYTYNRSIPARFFRNIDCYAGLLRGLFSANGSICGRRVTLKTTSKVLRDQVQLMLSALGIRSYYTTNKPSKVKFSNGEYLCKESYDINITSDREKFYSVIGFIQLYKSEKLRQIVDNTKPRRVQESFTIKSIEFVGEEEVFDITVDNESHTYWTGGLNVSNCGEIGLESYELCNLAEVFPTKHESLEDFLRTLKYAYLYAKTVTLGQTHWPETNRVLLRNRRIGCSVSGVQQFVAKHSLDDLKTWLDRGYSEIQQWDRIYSDWFCIPKSVKTTSVKPSGTVSLLAGATPGLHWPESRFYIRRVRLSKDSELLPGLRQAGYKVEPDIADKSAVVVEFPVDCGEGVRPVSSVSLWEQLEMAAFMQQHWADNQVSCTVSFDSEVEGRDIPKALEYYQYRLKGISFLPRRSGGAYAQAPYEQISEAQYNRLVAKVDSRISFGKLHDEAEPERFCDGEKCVL